MGVLKKLWHWWHDLWGCDLYSPMEVDSHRWENKVEIRRRLSASAN